MRGGGNDPVFPCSQSCTQFPPHPKPPHTPPPLCQNPTPHTLPHPLPEPTAASTPKPKNHPPQNSPPVSLLCTKKISPLSSATKLCNYIPPSAGAVFFTPPSLLTRTQTHTLSCKFERRTDLCSRQI